MTILHVTDFHFNPRWFHWLLHQAPPHDVLVMSGDLLDLTDPTPQRSQMAWVSRWLRAYPRPLCVCSGKHDLEWDAAEERWHPAYWLRSLARPGLWVDGQSAELNGLSLLNIGATTRPKGGAADYWVVHTPPSRTLVATRRSGGDAGDLRLSGAVHEYRPLVVFSGHVHSPLHWCGQNGDTLFLNPGRAADAEFPNHIVLHTDPLRAEFFSAGAPRETFVADSPSRRISRGERDASAYSPSPLVQPAPLLTTANDS
jgi:Icc-related predicted phosphoesterase